MRIFRGAVAAPRREAIEAGEAALRAGGNAIDAALAASTVLGVIEPYMTGPGAVGEALYLDPDGRCHVIDAAARAPFAASPGMYKVTGPAAGAHYAWPEVEDQGNVIGPRSVTAPRLYAGLHTLHKRFGRLSWASAFDAAIGLAVDGFEVDYFSAAVISHEMRTLHADPGSRALYYPEGYPIRPPIDGPPAVLSNPGLANALGALAADGPVALARGPVADALIASVSAGGGVLTVADLDDASREGCLLEDVQPATRFRGFSIFASPLPSGGITAAQILGILDRLPPLGGNATSPDRYERFVLASGFAFADRLTKLSGSEGPAAAARLLSPDNLDAGAEAVQAKRLAGRSPGAGHRPATATTCLAAVDADGGMVSITQTLLSFFGSQITVPRFGFQLNNGMLWFDPRPGSPNSIDANKRALAAVTPLIAVSPDGQRRIAMSGLGARRIISAVAQAVENRVDYGLPVQRSIDGPRVHFDTGETLVDQRLPAGVNRRLRHLGLSPTASEYGPSTVGIARLTAVEHDRRTGAGRAAVDARAKATWRFGRG
jgi:gamma-glutamyltranspeptidase/glutathione hydrolase